MVGLKTTMQSIFRPQPLRAALKTLAAGQNTFHPLSSTSSSFPPLSSATTIIRAASSKTTPTKAPPPAIPSPTPFVPNVETFLKVIGRGLSAHASKFPTWESLFSLTSDELRELGVEPPRTRKYLLRWRQRFRQGRYGIGGDLRHVRAEDGSADLRVLEVEDDGTDVGSLRHVRKYVVNVPPGTASARDCEPADLSRVQGYQVRGARTIAGPYALPLKRGEGARVTVTEGMWEDRRGVKIDGGERRRTMVRMKKRIAERREARERGEI
ncbi:IGR protein motif-domain-containing protein [Xylariomycetidae sp. FL2044]|nr:IGR protein motif-domain-containing protein [Xylariomycetidae sp. FL2044]